MADDARERIQKLLVTGDNRLKQGVAPEKVRETLRGGARSSRARRGSRTRSGRSSRSGSPISNGSQEDLLHPLRLQPDVVIAGRVAPGEVRARERRRLRRAPRRARRRRAGSTRTPDSGVTNSGGPPTVVATTERADAIASSVARPNGSTRLGWQTTSAAAIQCGHRRRGDAPDELGSPAGPRARRAAGRRRRTRASPRRAARTRARAGGRSCARSARRGRGTPCRRGSSRARLRAASASRGAKRSRSTPQSITSVLPRPPARPRTSRSRSQPETAMTVAARRTT